MNQTFSLTKRGRLIAVLSLLFFVVYCSVGVCTNLIGTSERSIDVVDHSQHVMQVDIAPAHCETTPASCEWGVNPISDPLFDLQPSSSFFFLYIAAVSTLLISVLLLFTNSRHLLFAFAKQQFFQRGYPRLHLQNAVFLN